MRIIWLLLSFPAIATAYMWGLEQVGLMSEVPSPQPGCHQSYAGACLAPYGGDYDCAGGNGNGPLYTGPVYVVGPDVFELDRDGDGIACE